MISSLLNPSSFGARRRRGWRGPSPSARVMPAISDGSPASRTWWAARNQFQQRDRFNDAGCSG